MSSINHEKCVELNGRITEVGSLKPSRSFLLFETTTFTTKSPDSTNFISMRIMARCVFSIYFLTALLIVSGPVSVHAGFLDDMLQKGKDVAKEKVGKVTRDNKDTKDVPSGKDLSHGSYSGGVLRCDPGYYKKKNDCVALPDIEGGQWLGVKLQCKDGYIKYKDREGPNLSPTEQRCVKMPEIANARYRGASPGCIGGYLMVKGPKCVPEYTVQDKSDIIYGDVTWLGDRFFCKEGYKYDAGICINTRFIGKSLVVADMTLQGLALGITEDKARKILKEKGYLLKLGTRSSYIKTSQDGTQKIIAYFVAVPDAKDDQFRLITHISYSQAYPKTVSFDLKGIYSDLQNRFGQADKSSFNASKKHMISNKDEFKLRYDDDDGPQHQAPMLWISGEKIFKKGVLTMDTFWNRLSDRLNEEYRAKLQKEEQSREQQKGKAIIDF